MPSINELSPRAARTRAALLNAGLELMVERPIDAIPIDDFIARAGVAKGSFFNHFTDKHSFANAVAAKVRQELEELVAQHNEGIEDPVVRIAGGMRVVAEFALGKPKQSVVLLRSQDASTSRADPLNKGLKADMDAACECGLLRAEAAGSGLLFWLGLCQVLMIHILERRPTRPDAQRRLSELIVMGLAGLGVDEARAAEIARRTAEGI